MKTALKEAKIKKARKDIVRILDQYRVTLPEVLGAYRPQDDPDEEIWRGVQRDYEKVQREVLAQLYPSLAQRTARRR